MLAVKLEPQARAICAGDPKRKMETTLIRLVAGELNNTVAVCRKYYIHPAVLKAALEGKLQAYHELAPNGSDWYSSEEKTVLMVLKEAQT